MQPIYVQKNLISASSTGIGTVSSAATPVVTLKTSSLDTQRRVIVWSSGGVDLSGTSFTIKGTREGGGTISETILGSTGASTSQTTLDFLSVTSISASNTPASLATFGTNSVGSSPWKLANWHVTPVNIGLAVLTSTTTPNYTVEYTYEDPTAVYPSLSTAAGPTPFQVTALTAKTGTLDGNIVIPVAAVRLTLNSGSSAGNTTMVVLQGAIG